MTTRLTRRWLLAALAATGIGAAAMPPGIRLDDKGTFRFGEAEFVIQTYNAGWSPFTNGSWSDRKVERGADGSFTLTGKMKVSGITGDVTEIIRSTNYWNTGLICPGATEALKNTNKNYPNCAMITRAYGVNAEGYPSSTDPYRSIKSSLIKNPSSKIWLIDGSDWVIRYPKACAPNAYYLWGENYNSSSQNNVTCYRHNDRANIVHCDGHLDSSNWHGLYDSSNTSTSDIYKEKWNVKQ